MEQEINVPPLYKRAGRLSSNNLRVNAIGLAIPRHNSLDPYLYLAVGLEKENGLENPRIGCLPVSLGA